MTRYKILHVLDSLDPRGGGPPAVAIRLAAAQAAEGCETHLASYHAPGAEAQIETELDRVPHARLIKQHFLPPPRGTDRVWASTARRALDELVPGMDFVHVHGVWDAILRAAAGVAARRKVPYVVAPHGMLDPWSLRQRALKKRLALALGYRRMLNRAAFLHALNADERELMAPLRLRCPVEVIPNGVFQEELEPLPPAGVFRARFPQLGAYPYVLFLSRLHYKKGLDFLADAFAILARARPEVHLVVVGPDGAERAPFERRVAEARLQERVHIVGPLYGPDKLAALVDAACFCLPSRQEGFSIAITEAMACGLPVVISDACHFPEVAQEHAGEVVPLHSGAIAAALQRVLSDPAAAEQMGKNGRRLVTSRYLWPKIAKRSIDAYVRVPRTAAAAR